MIKDDSAIRSLNLLSVTSIGLIYTQVSSIKINFSGKTSEVIICTLYWTQLNYTIIHELFFAFYVHAAFRILVWLIIKLCIDYMPQQMFPLRDQFYFHRVIGVPCWCGRWLGTFFFILALYCWIGSATSWVNSDTIRKNSFPSFFLKCWGMHRLCINS